jgi:hypothetical protein
MKVDVQRAVDFDYSVVQNIGVVFRRNWGLGPGPKPSSSSYLLVGVGACIVGAVELKQ